MNRKPQRTKAAADDAAPWDPVIDAEAAVAAHLATGRATFTPIRTMEFKFSFDDVLAAARKRKKEDTQ
jgi:hypothetical protein